jgi:hypothetical protein
MEGVLILVVWLVALRQKQVTLWHAIRMAGSFEPGGGSFQDLDLIVVRLGARPVEDWMESMEALSWWEGIRVVDVGREFSIGLELHGWMHMIGGM